MIYGCVCRRLRTSCHLAKTIKRQQIYTRDILNLAQKSSEVEGKRGYPNCWKSLEGGIFKEERGDDILLKGDAEPEIEEMSVVVSVVIRCELWSFWKGRLEAEGTRLEPVSGRREREFSKVQVFEHLGFRSP